MKTMTHLAGTLLLLLTVAACESTPVATEDPVSESAPVIVEPQEIILPGGQDPLAGTSWQLLMLVSDYTKPFVTMFLDFSDDGYVTHTIVFPNDREITETDHYYVSRGRLYIKSGIGPERKASFKFFGDQLTIDTQSATARLRRVDKGAPRDTVAHDAASLEERPLIDHPLAGTFWRSRLIVGDTKMYVSSTYEFSPRGLLTVELVHRNRSRSAIERFYRVEDERLVLIDRLGHEISAKMTMRNGDLKIDFQNATVVMAQADPDEAEVLTR